MCGIAGMVGEVNADVIATMTRVLSHRGPDGEGVVCDRNEGFALGHRRLSIIDLSPRGAQPMADPKNRFWLTYNGEVYNYRSLRSELEAHGRRFRSETDSEVVLAAYERWGQASLERLNGMFAFAVWDRERRELFLARDRLGIKPLCWASFNGGLLFASEVKSILSSGLAPAVADPEALRNPWHYPSSPRTGFVGIHQLPAAHLLTWRGGSIAIRKWWDIVPAAADPGWEESADELAHLLEEAVRIQMVADVPVGLMLSGGLDSSTVLALMRRETGRPVKTFSITFHSKDRALERVADDARHARDVARRFGCEHDEIEVSARIADLIERVAWHLDGPIADAAAINSLLIAEKARAAGVKVLLTGMGADELFGGYRKYLACLLAERYRRLMPGLVRRALDQPLLRLPVAGTRMGFRSVRWGKRFLRLAALPPVDRFLASDLSITAAEYRDMYADAESYPYETLSEVEHRRELFKGTQGSQLRRMCLTDTRVFLPDHNLAYTDKSTMAAGVEARPALIDHRIAELAFRIPDIYKIRGWEQKRLLKEVARRWLPRSIVSRPKAPFGAPLRAWIRRDLREMVDDLLSERALQARGVYRTEAVRRIIQRDREGREDHAQLIWTLLWREVWLRTVVERVWPRPGTMPDVAAAGPAMTRWLDPRTGRVPS